MAAPDAIINGDRLYMQHYQAGVAQGHPDVVLAFSLDVGDQIHFYDFQISTTTWSETTSIPYTWVPDKSQVGDGTVHYQTHNGKPDVIIVKAQGTLYSTEIGKEASSLGHEADDTNFYASDVTAGSSLGQGAPILNKDKVRPFATEMSAVKSAKTNGGKLAGGSSGGSTSGGSTSGGTTTTGTSQSTMYVIGGGALIGLLFLFTQKK